MLRIFFHKFQFLIESCCHRVARVRDATSAGFGGIGCALDCVYNEDVLDRCGPIYMLGIFDKHS